MFGDDLVVIREKLSQEELLCQLAEEAAELAQAALKLRRAYSTVNPTVVGKATAYQNLKEEIADVMLLVYALGLDGHTPEYSQMMNYKADRWCKRLNREV